ncbi:hypothetical protein N9E91_04655 [Alphaproteobacteria bacterium]|jgi:hypothetical protein|nr:hypothetical protein [Alphaproteobacteria bacterium]NCF48113.1 hypothetical protein [Bacteroidota bacterium]
MAEDVIDIRKRIEEIRNEVSSAMNTREETVIESRPAGEIAEFSVAGITSAAPSRSADHAVAVNPELLPNAKTALDSAMAMPSFQLNVRNQNTNKTLLILVSAQVLTNICLIAIFWYKLGL